MKKKEIQPNEPVKKPGKDEFIAGVERALRRAAKDARKIARFYGTPIYIEKDGRIIAIKP